MYRDVRAWRWVARGADTRVYSDEGRTLTFLSISESDSVYVVGCSSAWCTVVMYARPQPFYIRARGLLTRQEYDPAWTAERARVDSVLRARADSLARVVQARTAAMRARADSVTAFRRADSMLRVADSIAFTRRVARDGQGKWTVTTSHSLMDDSPIIILRLRAENVAVGWLAAHRPSLIVRCKEGETDVYVVTGMSSNPELGAFEEVTVRLRFDAMVPSEEVWSETTSNDALMSRDPVNLAIRLARSRRFRVEFTPFNANPQVVTFDVRGLARHLPRIARACPGASNWLSRWPDDWQRRMYEGAASIVWD